MTTKSDDYYAKLASGLAETAAAVRNAVLSDGSLQEDFKWGHPIYRTDLPVCLIKAAKSHVSLGFWQGRLLLDRGLRLEASGNGDMAIVRFAAPEEVDATAIVKVVRAAVELMKGAER